MATTRTNKRVTVVTANDLGRALGLSAADTAEMEFRSELTVVLAKIIQAGRLTHAAIAKSAGTSRTRVTATDVLIRVLAATGLRAKSGSKRQQPNPIICRWKDATSSPSFRPSGSKKSSRQPSIWTSHCPTS